MDPRIYTPAQLRAAADLDTITYDQWKARRFIGPVDPAATVSRNQTQRYTLLEVLRAGLIKRLVDQGIPVGSAYVFARMTTFVGVAVQDRWMLPPTAARPGDAELPVPLEGSWAEIADEIQKRGFGSPVNITAIYRQAAEAIDVNAGGEGGTN